MEKGQPNVYPAETKWWISDVSANRVPCCAQIFRFTALQEHCFKGINQNKSQLSCVCDIFGALIFLKCSRNAIAARKIALFLKKYPLLSNDSQANYSFFPCLERVVDYESKLLINHQSNKQMKRSKLYPKPKQAIKPVHVGHSWCAGLATLVSLPFYTVPSMGSKPMLLQNPNWCLQTRTEMSLWCYTQGHILKVTGLIKICGVSTWWIKLKITVLLNVTKIPFLTLA